MKKATPQQIADTRKPRFQQAITEQPEQTNFEATMIVSNPDKLFNEREKFLIFHSLRHQFDYVRSINDKDRLDMITILEKLDMLDKATEMCSDMNV